MTVEFPIVQLVEEMVTLETYHHKTNMTEERLFRNLVSRLLGRIRRFLFDTSGSCSTKRGTEVWPL